MFHRLPELAQLPEAVHQRAPVQAVTGTVEGIKVPPRDGRPKLWLAIPLILEVAGHQIQKIFVHFYTWMRL
jgi:hypothetical protein